MLQISAMRVWLAVLLLVYCCSSSHALVVLQYHHVSDSTPKSTSVSPALFAEHLDYLQSAGFQVLALPEVAKLLRQQKPLPDKAVVITFDDGYMSIYSQAYPLLKEKGWPFTIFINSAPHDAKSAAHISWQGLREMAENKATIANHGRSHTHFIRRNLDDSALRLMREEVIFTEQRIKAEIGSAYKLLAYPYGEYDSVIAKRLAEAGYIAFGQHSGAVPADVDLQRVPRFPFGGVYGDLSDFKTKVNSLALSDLQSTITSEQGLTLVDSALPQGVTRPVLNISLPASAAHLQWNCFASGQGAIAVSKLKTRPVSLSSESKTQVDQQPRTYFQIQANKALPVGRSRYNCTARSAQKGRFYWASWPFIRRAENGRWVHD